MRRPASNVLETNRLLVRPSQKDDVAALVEFYRSNEAHLTPFEPARPARFYTERFWSEQVDMHRHAREEGVYYAFYLFPRSEPQRIVGQISLNQIVRGPAQMAHVGYALDEKSQGRGLMAEALQAVIQFAFSELNLHRLMANFMPHNQRSNNVLRRLGFTVEGYARDYLHIGGEWRDHVLTSLTNADWAPRAD